MKKTIFTALALLQLLFIAGCGGTAVSGNPDIVLIIIDSMRSDHMSMNGYGRETTPVMDSLAANGTTWTRAQAQSCWTLPSIASTLTGLPQRSHGAGFADGQVFGIDQALPTLPLLLKRSARYQTAAFFNSAIIGEELGFQGGFDFFDCRGFLGKDGIRDAGMTVDDFLKWYDSGRDPNHPLFVALHFFDPHLPYSPPPPYDSLFGDPKADPLFNPFWGSRYQVDGINRGSVHMSDNQLEIMVALYDGELAFTDRQIGRLISGLADRGTLYNTVFVVIGSQGEELLDHGGFGHGHTLYQELLDVPMIISGRGIPISVRNDVAAQIDILPTLLGLAEVEKPIWAEGRNLMAGDSVLIQRYVPSSNLVWADQDLLTLRFENRLVIGNPGDMEAVLFDLDADPDQLDPMLPSRDSKDQLYYFWSIPPRGNPRSAGIMDGTAGMLRDLGYVR
ncbi:MAG: sulfatase [Candidatus Fermentibacteraceae bacterium]|nr:sulfatase [Candidatus Fermentibacteraceae bacterium]